MEVISFDISGKFAHFRKFYSNNTALSYSIPPRTTIIGMIAALLGKEKNSYYQSMSSDKLRIGIRALCPLKKSFHRLNLLKIVGNDDFRGKNGRVQTPFEIVSAVKIGSDNISYRIYVSYLQGGESIYDEIKQALTKRKFVYNLSLGSANFSATVNKINIYGGTEIQQDQSDEKILLHSAVNSSKVHKICINKDEKLLIEEEQIPCDFIHNNSREVLKMQRFLYSINEHPIPIILKEQFYKLTNKNGESVNIMFLE